MNLRRKMLYILFASVISPSSVYAGVIDIKLNPAATYLHTFSDPAPYSPAIDLLGLGFSVNEIIELRVTGAFVQSGGIGYDHRGDLLGVFSSSSNLDPYGSQNRVPGAIDAGMDVFTKPTFYGGESTDIPQDFQISAYSLTSGGNIIQNPVPDHVDIQIPAGARYLFVSPNDNYFVDNFEYAGNFYLHVSDVHPVPEPSSITLLAGGLAGFAALIHRRRKASICVAESRTTRR